jgi:hypothetical protein
MLPPRITRSGLEAIALHPCFILQHHELPGDAVNRQP